MPTRNRSPFALRPSGRARPGLTVRAQDDGATEVLVYDEIGIWGIDAESFVRELAAIDSPLINLRINSPGGNVFEGRAMATALRRHPARVVSTIDGLAASIATEIALAGDEVVMATGAFMMIHEPWTITLGNADDLRKDANLLDQLGDSLVDLYVNRTGRPESEIRQLVADETWFNAEQAIDIGLADRVDTDDGDSAEAAARFDLSIFAHVPAALKGDQRAPTERDLERALRDAGLSGREAVAFVARGKKALAERDAGRGRRSPAPRDAGDGVETVVAAMKRATAVLTQQGI